MSTTHPKPIDSVDKAARPAHAAPPAEEEVVERRHDPRTLALTILMLLALLFAVQWAAKFLVPMAFGIFVAFTLNPVVVWLERLRIPRFIGTSIVIGAICLGAAAAASTLQAEFGAISAKLPVAAHKIARAVEGLQGDGPSTVQQMQRAAAEIEKATTGEQSSTRKPNPPPAQPLFKVTEWIWAGSMNAVGFVTEAIMVIFLVFFLLLAGDSFKRKLVKIAGPTLSEKKIAVHILDDINVSIQRYMFMLLVTNSLLALLVWITFRLIGLENAGAWALAAGLFHLVPYFGPLLITVTSGVTAFMQFESLYMALLTAGITLAIATLIGTFVTTWMVGKIAHMNPTAVFVGLLFWGWLWGLWGLLLGIPIIVIVKVVAENIGGRMEPIAELLGE